jgi:hypothetical protein
VKKGGGARSARRGGAARWQPTSAALKHGALHLATEVEEVEDVELEEANDHDKVAVLRALSSGCKHRRWLEDLVRQPGAPAPRPHA